jgi:hypothetical protein
MKVLEKCTAIPTKSYLSGYISLTDYDMIFRKFLRLFSPQEHCTVLFLSAHEPFKLSREQSKDNHKRVYAREKNRLQKTVEIWMSL